MVSIFFMAQNPQAAAACGKEEAQTRVLLDKFVLVLERVRGFAVNQRHFCLNFWFRLRVIYETLQFTIGHP
jgi:hypothetical protein